MITWRRLLLVLLIALLIVTAALAVSSPIQAQDRRSPAPLTEATLIAVSDTYLDEADPAANFGDSRTLSVGRTDSRVPTETHLLVRFDLAGIPAHAGLIQIHGAMEPLRLSRDRWRNQGWWQDRGRDWVGPSSARAITHGVYLHIAR